MVFKRNRRVVLKGVLIFLTACIFNILKPVLFPCSNRQVKVLIVSYMRSGSTLTGDILQYSRESFYAYEPLRAVCPSDCSSVASSNLIFANGIKGSVEDLFHEEAYTTLKKWFNCNLHLLSTAELFDISLSKGWKTRTFFSCYREATFSSMNRNYALNKCLKNLISMCNTSPINIARTIRTNLRTVKYLLDEIPDLRIIHIIRDPRATISALSRAGMCPVANYGKYKCASRHCNRLESDIEENIRITEQYPDRILTFEYENLARFPIETSQKIYDFIGVRMTSLAREFVYNKTMADRTENCAKCSNTSLLDADSWKRRINKDLIGIANKTCNNILHILGYK